MKHRILVASLGVLAAAFPVLAHHSISAEFDPAKEFSVEGVITQVDWINPHIAVHVTVTDEKYGAGDWACEGSPPATYRRAGLQRSDFKVGEEVTITCVSPKDGSKRWGFLKMIKYHSDGHVLVLRIGGE
jgi:hypothetical protein